MSESDTPIDDIDTPENPNEQWLHSRVTWAAYFGIIALFRILAGALAPIYEAGAQWTFVGVAHSMLTYILFHHMRGTPFGDTGDDGQGRWRLLTQWEQLDAETQLTITRKFYTIVPVLIYMIALPTVDYDDYFSFALNTVALLLCVIPKTPFMHKVRLFWFYGNKFVEKES